MSTSISTRLSNRLDARTLFLGSSGLKKVTCTDAALVVHTAKAQVLRYPINRISKVICCAEAVDWSGQALALCMANNISLTWTNTMGIAVGSAFPLMARPLQLQTNLEIWLDSEGGHEKYQTWLKSRRLVVLTKWSELNKPSPKEWEDLKRSWVYREELVEHLAPQLRSHCVSQVASVLADEGLSPNFIADKLELIPLVTDLAYLLWAEMNLCYGELATEFETEFELANLFDKWMSQNGGTLYAHIHNLHKVAYKGSL